MENLPFFVPLFGLAGLAIAFITYRRIVLEPGGEGRVAEIAGQIHDGAMVFMRRELLLIGAFAVVVGGIYVALGPTVGAIITIMLAEGLRIGFGTKAVGWDNLVYGVLLVVFIIFLPKGILGSLLNRIKPSSKR